MPARILTADRTAMAQALITAWGTGVKIKLYDGAMPTNLGVPAGALKATLTNAGSIGTASAGAIDIDEAGFTQSNGSHVAGTPTFARITTSGDVAKMDIAIGAGTDEWPFTGTVANGQNVTLTGLSIVMPNAST